MSTATEPPRTGAPGGTAGDVIKAIPARHPGRWIATVVVLFFSVTLVLAIATSKSIEWGIVGHYFTTRLIFEGLLRTLELTALAMVIGVALGVVLAVMRLSPVRVISTAAWVYIWFFRGTPVFVQLLLWFNIAALTGPHPAVGFPLTHIVFFHLGVNTLITSFVAATLAFGLNEAAYMAEIVRAGILSVDEGQTEAAQSLGMTRLQTMRLIVLPQAMRVIIPPTGNETISMLKTTALASAIALPELLGTSEQIYSASSGLGTFQVIPLLVVASIWYLIVTSILTAGQYYVERYFARGASRTLPPTPLQRLRAMFTRNLTTFHAPALPPAIPGQEHR